MSILLTLKSQTLYDGQSIAAAEFIDSATDSSGRKIAEYAFCDDGAGGGYFTYDGVKQPEGKWFTVSASRLSEIAYVAGAGAGGDTISVEAFDGAQWSAPYSTTATILLPPPMVTASVSPVDQGQTDFSASPIASHDSAEAGGGVAFLGGGAPVWRQFASADLSEQTFSAAAPAGGTTSVVPSFSLSSPASTVSAATTTTTTTSSSIVSQLKDPGIAADVAKLMVNNSLSYNSMLTILEDAAARGMTATKFSTLQTLASLLNAANGISVSSYVQQLADDVIDGDSANAYWNGGSSTATKLGNLSATSTQTQVTELIGKWFLGADLPSMSVSAIGESNLNPTYQACTLPLYGASGAPKYTDVNQGYLGDCYFVSSLGETALQDPSLIESMITSDGGGVYTVRFYINGQADYVTVNDELPVMSGYEWANGSTLEFANGSVSWVALVEKAFVELNEQTAAAQAGGHTTGDAYEDINGGTAYALTEITDDSYTTYALSSKTSTASLNSLMSTLGADWKAGDDIILSTPNATSGNLVGDHMYEVIGVNASAGTITLQNPWNTAYSGSLAMTFTETIQQLAKDDCDLYATTGTKVA